MSKKIASVVFSPGNIDLFIDTRQKLRVLASLEGQTMQEYLGWMVTKAYEAAIINRGRKLSLPKGNK